MSGPDRDYPVGLFAPNVLGAVCVERVDGVGIDPEPVHGQLAALAGATERSLAKFRC